MPTDQEFEEQLARALAAVGDSLPAESGLTVTAGLDRGRRRWRRRSAVAAVGSATALVLIGAGTYALVAPGPTAAPAPAPAAPPTGASASPAPSPSRLLPDPAVGSAQVLAALRAAVPGGAFGEPASVGKAGGESGSAFLTTTYDDGHGAGQVSVMVARRSASDAMADNTCPDAKIVPVDSCTTTTLADGARLVVLQGYEYPDRRVDTKRWTATLSGPDGRWIALDEWNAPQEKDAPTSRANPPLDAARLAAAATSTAWNPILAALPAPPATPARRVQFPAQEILATAAKLLPAGLTEADPSGDGDGYADFTVRDAKGRSMVGINVQDWRRDLADLNAGKQGAAAQVYASGRTLPDGTRIAESQEGHNPGRWVVDILRPDGLRVVVFAYNSAGPREAASRPAPVLTVEQMRAIALSPAWHLPS